MEKRPKEVQWTIGKGYLCEIGWCLIFYFFLFNIFYNKHLFVQQILSTCLSHITHCARPWGIERWNRHCSSPRADIHHGGQGGTKAKDSEQLESHHQHHIYPRLDILSALWRDPHGKELGPWVWQPQGTQSCQQPHDLAQKRVLP